jgi:hypothetical protein
MRGRLVTAASGLVLTAALGVPAAAQGAVTRPSPADARTTAARPGASLSCAPIDDLGNNHYAGWGDASHTKIYFGAGLSHAIPFCNVNAGNGEFYIEEEINGHLSGECLTGFVGGYVGEYPCSEGGTMWSGIREGTYHNQTIWEFLDYYSPGQCLYDDLQDPAIEASCTDSDGFEHFVWDALP